jgi:hypothetical protein
MGRSHKDRDAQPIKTSTLKPLLNDTGANEGAGEGAGVVIGNQAPGPRKIGGGPGDAEDPFPGGQPDAKS